MNLQNLAIWLEDTFAGNDRMREVARDHGMIDAAEDFARAAQRARNMRSSLGDAGARRSSDRGPRAA